jgi:dihydroorotate dehydrogenase
MWYDIVRPALFKLDAEFSHDLTLKTLKLLSGLKLLHPPENKWSAISTQCFGLSFPNPVGLAAGLDKNAECLSAWNAMGFGFIEVGTVTPKPQIGNPKPRLFRIPEYQAIINRMGFNNKGIDYLLERVKHASLNCPLGINIGKNKDTPLESAKDDYLFCFQAVYPYADYVTVNLSSPNTPGLKSLQHGELLKSILEPLKSAQYALADKFNKNVPILVKISPDLDEDEIKNIIDTLVELKIDGVIATNTTVRREKIIESPVHKEEGGLSGTPLFATSTHVIRVIYQHVGSVLPIIAVGGITSPSKAREKFQNGARLIQLYTGLIYQGPQLVKDILSHLIHTS